MKSKAKKQFYGFVLVFFFANTLAFALDNSDVGKKAYRNGDYASAFNELKPIAETGDAQTQTLLADMYAKGQGVEKNDAEAVSWYSKAAAKGGVDAQFNLSDMYASGTGTEKNPSMAAYWQWRAAYSLMWAAKKTLDNAYVKARHDNQRDDKTTDAEVRVDPVVDVSKCAKPKYPREAQNENQEGKVRLLLLIDANGKVLESSIDQTSGFQILDQASLDSFRLCIFSPATINGVAVPQLFKMEYTWELWH